MRMVPILHQPNELKALTAKLSEQEGHLVASHWHIISTDFQGNWSDGNKEETMSRLYISSVMCIRQARYFINKAR